MSFCRKEGKDTILFVTKEDHEKASTVELSEPEPSPGLMMPDGTINWNCPCLGGMATGPCGVEFRDAFTCFHYSTAEPKGSNCFSVFQEMQDCMASYPSVYDTAKDDEEFPMGGEDNDDSKNIGNKGHSDRPIENSKSKSVVEKNK